jgi:effector-binding domain-containing protein
LRTAPRKKPVPNDSGATGLRGRCAHDRAVRRERDGLLPTEYGEVNIEIGIEIVREFEAICDVACSATSAGTEATLVQTGSDSALPASLRAVIEWSRKNGRRLAGVSWEVYGDWNDDPAQWRTEDFHLLEHR